MAKEWIDIVDTAVKIGLGSLITGSFAYIGLKLNKESVLNKHFVEHKTKLIEDAMKYSQEYFVTKRMYISTLKGITKDLKNTDFVEIPKGDRHILATRNDALVEGWVPREKAIATFSLLGAEKCVKLLKETSNIESELRNIIIFQNKLPTYDFSTSLSKRSNTKISEIQKEISIFYNNFYKK